MKAVDVIKFVADKRSELQILSCACQARVGTIFFADVINFSEVIVNASARHDKRVIKFAYRLHDSLFTKLTSKEERSKS